MTDMIPPPERAAAFLRKHPPYEFIADKTFDRPGAGDEILAPMPGLAEYTRQWEIGRRMGGAGPSYVTVMCEAPVLSREQERHLFRKMNYLKWRANIAGSAARDGLGPVDRFAQLVAEVDVVRNQLIQSNLRLVVSLVKKQQCPSQDEFNERLSDGNWSLIRAIENFDYRRGVKFGTYGTWSIVRNWSGQIAKAAPTSGDLGDLCDIPDHRVPDDGLTSDDASAVVDKLMRHIDKRWQNVVKLHSGIGGDKLTLKEIGAKLNISRERARQIRAKSLNKMRDALTVHYPQLEEELESQFAR